MVCLVWPGSSLLALLPPRLLYVFLYCLHTVLFNYSSKQIHFQHRGSPNPGYTLIIPCFAETGTSMLPSLSEHVCRANISILQKEVGNRCPLKSALQEA